MHMSHTKNRNPKESKVYLIGSGIASIYDSIHNPLILMKAAKAISK